MKTKNHKEHWIFKEYYDRKEYTLWSYNKCLLSDLDEEDLTNLVGSVNGASSDILNMLHLSHINHLISQGEL